MSYRITLEPISFEHAHAIQKLATSHPDIVKLTHLPDPTFSSAISVVHLFYDHSRPAASSEGIII